MPPVYNVHPYFSLSNLSKNVHITHGKIQCFSDIEAHFVYFKMWSSIPVLYLLDTTNSSPQVPHNLEDMSKGIRVVCKVALGKEPLF